MLLQDDTLPCFTADAVLLTHFLRLGKKDRVLDAGCGTGLISVLGEGYTGASFTGVDICPELVALAGRSAERNGQDIRFETLDILEVPARFGEGAFTAAVWNPPYFAPAASGEPRAESASRAEEDGDGAAVLPHSSTSEGEPERASGYRARALARHADDEALRAMARALFRGVKNGGRLFVCFPCGSLARIFRVLSDCRWEPKRLRLVAHTPADSPYLALIEAKKDGAAGLVIEPLAFDK